MMTSRDQLAFRINEADANASFYANSAAHGFWTETEHMRTCLVANRPDLVARFDVLVISEKIALIHSELSEALEALRKDKNTPDHHVPQFTNFEVELADARIRIGDLAHALQLALGEAIIAKHQYNASREYKHGKQS